MPGSATHVRFKKAWSNPGAPRDVAEACLYLAADSGGFVTGQAIHVNGGEYMF